MKDGVGSKMEGFEDDSKAHKVFMLHAITREHQLEQVGELIVSKE